MDGDIKDGEPIAGGTDIHIGYPHLAGGEGGGDVHQQVVAVLADHLQAGGVAHVHVLAPADMDPAARLLLLVGKAGVGAVGAVDGHPVTPGDVADDVVPGHGGAAL